jgi:hypothetical protein
VQQKTKEQNITCAAQAAASQRLGMMRVEAQWHAMAGLELFTDIRNCLSHKAVLFIDARCLLAGVFLVAGPRH